MIPFTPKNHGEGSASPPTPPPRRRRLDTLPRLRRELIALYHEARAGDLDTQAATRLGWLLVAASKLIEGGEFEARLEAIEKRLEGER